MGFYSTTLEQEKPHQKTSDCAQKTASGKFFASNRNRTYQIERNPLENQQEKLTATRETASGVFFYKYRHYSAELGRWPSRDPIEEMGGVNLYVFAGNDGINGWDSLGLYSSTEIVKNVMKVMKHKGWSTAHKLMSYWWSRAANNDPKAHINDSIVKMDWALQDPDANAIYIKHTTSSYKTTNAKNLLIKRLKSVDKWETGGTFGYLYFKASDFEAGGPDGEMYINSKSFKGDPPLTDFGAALGRFQMRVAVAGCLDTSFGAKRFIVKELHTYIIDSYDFNDAPVGLDPRTWIDQQLGYWDFEANEVLNEVPFSGGWHYTRVDNGDFRSARKATGKGGDFTVHSDVKVDQTFDILDLK